MEESHKHPLLKKIGKVDEGLTMGFFKEEVKKVAYIAGPMVAVNLSFFLIQVISMMMVGHISELALSGTAIATSLSAVTGFSLLLGMACGLETLCGQAFGAREYKKLGVHTYSAIISLSLVCLPISLLWVSVEKLLIFIGQDPLISHEAGKYAMSLIPAAFAYASLQPLMRFLQSQSLIFPMLLSASTTLCFHIPLCWGLVYKTGLGNVGAALAIGLSYWLNVILLALYVKYSSSCEETRVPLTKEAFEGIGEFLRLALPSAVMICLEWWSFELLILLSGLLPNPELETSVLSICLTTTTFLYAIPYGIAAAVSTRVSNELGAGRPQAARIAVYAVIVVAVIEMTIVGSVLFASRHILGYAYSNEKEVVEYVTEMVPLICLSVTMDSLTGVLSGVARGCGWQHIGAYVNLGAFYLVGIPVAALLGFHLHYGGKGLWIGIVTGTVLQSTSLALITSRTNWEKQAMKARERMSRGEEVSIEDGLLK